MNCSSLYEFYLILHYFIHNNKLHNFNPLVQFCLDSLFNLTIISSLVFLFILALICLFISFPVFLFQTNAMNKLVNHSILL
jgi:hypothetical protein